MLAVRKRFRQTEDSFGSRSAFPEFHFFVGCRLSSRNCFSPVTNSGRV